MKMEMKAFLNKGYDDISKKIEYKKDSILEFIQ